LTKNSNINDYWTEKIADAFLGYAVPIYYGCKNIHTYFSENSYLAIDINNKKSAYSLVENIIENAESIYNEKRPHLIEARKKCLFEFNIFYHILSFIKKHISKSLSREIIYTEIQSSTIFHDADAANKCLMFKRRFIKNVEKIIQ
jgi:hypothetical protein